MTSPTVPPCRCSRLIAVSIAAMTLPGSFAAAHDAPDPTFFVPVVRDVSEASTIRRHPPLRLAGGRLLSRPPDHLPRTDLDRAPQRHTLWALPDLPFPKGAPRLAYAGTIHRWAREYAAGSWQYRDEGDRRIDAVATLALDGELRDVQILWNLHQVVGDGREFGMGVAVTERSGVNADSLSNAAVALTYRAEAENGFFGEVWLGATVTSPAIGEGAAARLRFGIDRPETGISLTLDRYTSDYFPAARRGGSHLPGTWGISLDASHVLSLPTGPINEIYLLFTPFFRATEGGKTQGRGFDLLLSASSFEADTSFDLYYSKASYLTRIDPWSIWSIWSADYSDDMFIEATASFCNSCRWRPSFTFSDGEFSGSGFREAETRLQYKVSDTLTATASAAWINEDGDRSDRQEILLRWRPSHQVSATLGARAIEGAFDRARLKIDAGLNPTLHTSVSAWIYDDGVGFDGDLIQEIGRGAAFRGSLKYDSRGDAEAAGQIMWRF